jgi:hypothetical protein
MVGSHLHFFRVNTPNRLTTTTAQNRGGPANRYSNHGRASQARAPGAATVGRAGTGVGGRRVESQRSEIGSSDPSHGSGSHKERSRGLFDPTPFLRESESANLHTGGRAGASSRKSAAAAAVADGGSGGSSNVRDHQKINTPRLLPPEAASEVPSYAQPTSVPAPIGSNFELKTDNSVQQLLNEWAAKLELEQLLQSVRPVIDCAHHFALSLPTLPVEFSGIRVGTPVRQPNSTRWQSYLL